MKDVLATKPSVSDEFFKKFFGFGSFQSFRGIWYSSDFCRGVHAGDPVGLSGVTKHGVDQVFEVGDF